MTPLAFLLIVASAGLHASWNMIAKKSHISLAFYAFLFLVGALAMSWVRLVSPLYFFSMPPKFYLWLFCSFLSELFYGNGLVLSYRHMDMSAAYPMMRSLPLLITALLTTLCGWGRPLSVPAMIGMAVVFAGCLMMPLGRFSDFKLSNYLNRRIFFIFLVACGTTGYTICDSQAQLVMRAAFPEVPRPMISMSYYEFRATVLAVVFWLPVLMTRRSRREAGEFWRGLSWQPVLAGIFAAMTYVLVLLAMNFVTNVSYVQAFRQLGLLIGMLEGIFILKERCTAPKVAGLTLILSGLALTLL